MKHTKKIILAVIIAFVCVGAVSAKNHKDDRRRVPTVGTAVTVTGTLQLINGEIAVVQSGNTYYVGQLHHLIGFVTGLQEGATVTLKGTAYQIPLATNFYKLSLSEMTISGRTYTGLDQR